MWSFGSFMFYPGTCDSVSFFGHGACHTISIPQVWGPLVIQCHFRRVMRCLKEEKMLKDITTLLGGRVAEADLQDITTGA